MRGRVFAATCGLVLAACGESAPAGGGAAGGGAGGGAGGAGGASGEAFPPAFPTAGSLYDGAVSRTCSLNDGVCHGGHAYPDLGRAEDLLALVGAPCQLGEPDPSRTLDACEVRGDALVVGGGKEGIEILQVVLGPEEPFPPRAVALRLAADAPALDPDEAEGSLVRRSASGGGAGESLEVRLEGVLFAEGPTPRWVHLSLEGASLELRRFFDVRVASGGHVRAGDPNGNGKAHASPEPFRLVVPGDPSRSFLYRRLLGDELGPRMPLVERAWSAAATRAIYCWVRGMPKNATPGSLRLDDPIDYESCPPDPEAPDPDAEAGWPAVRKLFAARCASGPCHSPEGLAAGLDLSPDPSTFLEQVIGVSSTQVPSMPRVTPGQPGSSYLLCKVDPKCASRAPETALMPLSGEALTAEEVRLVSDWILAGAPLE